MSLLNQTDPEKLLSLLRGEVGEIIQSWIVLNIYNYKAKELQTGNLQVDMKNQNLNLLQLVRHKFKDDIILRLSELSSSKHGRLNFHFASDKFGIQKQEINKFSKYLKEKHLIFRRNKIIAHKQISPKWDQIDPSPYVSNSTLVRAIAMALSIMKKFDEDFYGIQSKLLWKEERKRRYEMDMQPAAAKYILLPYVARIK